MTSVAARREMIDAIKGIPARERAWISGEDPGVWAYNALGIVLNSAQEEEINNVLRWPPGTIHVWRFANRTGKTAGLVILHMLVCWRKWRYVNPEQEYWLGFKYKTLQAAPSNRLMGRAWSDAEAITKGVSTLQQHPRTFRQRAAKLAPYFQAGKSQAADGSDELWLRCANNSQVDFLSTSENAARLESEKWWLIAWDEFVRQEPVGDIPILFDQTMLARSSDYMAPVIMSGTETDDSAPIYAELEEVAAENPRDWNFVFHARAENFTQSKASIDRQLRVSLDKSIAQRSVMGMAGEGGRGTLYPTFLLNNAFSDTHAEKSRPLSTEIVVTTFDHAFKGDLSAMRSFAVPWPIPANLDDLIGKIRVISAVERRSSATLTPQVLIDMLVAETSEQQSRFVVIDSTGQGGVGMFRMARQMQLPIRDCCFSKREPGLSINNKELGLQTLQHILDYGLAPKAKSETGWVNEWENPARPFGMLRIPSALRKDRRELAVLRQDDQHMAQDRAMCYVMFGWWLAPYIRRFDPPKAQPFCIVPKRPRSRLAMAGRMRGR